MHTQARLTAIASATLLALICAGAAAAAPGGEPGPPVAVTGELTVLIQDDFEHRRAELLHLLEDRRTGERFRLRFEGAPPGQLKSGAVVRVRGRLRGQEIYLAADGDGSTGVETLAAAAPAVTGEQSTLVMVADFVDKSVSCSVDSIRDLMFTDPSDGSVDDLYQETSFGAVWFTGQAVGAYPIDYTSDACDFAAWGDAADAAARADGVEPDAYSRKLYVLPPNGCPAAGIGTVGGDPSRAWIFTCHLPDVFGHELGHNLGMGHAATPEASYGDSSDIMGSGGKPLRQINAPHKEQMGWLLDGEIQTVTGDGVYEVAPLEVDPSSAVAAQALKLAKPDTNDYYYLSYRRPIGFDANLYSRYLDNVSVHVHPGDASASSTYLVANLADGESFVDSVNGITVTQQGRTPDYATVDVRFDGAGPICTPSAPTLTASPASQSGATGEALAYAITLTNGDGASCAASTFALDGAVPTSWGATVSPSTLGLAPSETASATLWVTSSGSASDGGYAVGVNVSDSAETLHAGSASATYLVTTACSPVPPALGASPASQAAQAGEMLGYSLSVTNLDGAGCGASTFGLDASVPAGWGRSIAPASLTLLPGETGSATLSVSSAGTAVEGSYPVDVHVQDAAEATRADSRPVSYEVLAPTGDTQPPSVPGGLSASVKRKHVALAWGAATDDVGVSHYMVRRDGVQIGSTTGTGYADRAVSSGVTYVYVVVAHDAAGNASQPSDPASVTFQQGGGKSAAKGGGRKR